MSNEHKVERQLSLYLNESDQLPDCLYLYGQKSVGKSFFLQKFLKKHKWLKSVIINTSECYNSRILFETIINTFNDHHPSEENAYTSFGKVDSIEDFLSELSNMNSVESYAVVIENAEKLRDMEFNIFPVFSKLPEFTGLNIICIFVSHLAYEKLGSPANIIEIHVPDFTKDDIVSILSSKYKETHCKIIKSIEKNASLSVDERNVQLAIAVNLDEAFYKNYLVTFLNVFYKACRDITELQFISYKCYVSYYTPVLKGEIEYTDVTNLYRNISKVLKQSLQTGHMRIGNLTEKQIIAGEENSLEPTKENHVRSFAQTLELPFFAKYLLIASFLASHNDAKFDKRLFMKHHGKERKRQQKAKVSEKMNIQFGPKSFTIDRLLAIFYAILDEKVGLTCNLLSQISTLVNFNFLTFVSGENNIMEGSARLQSTIGLDFAINIGKVVGFNVKQYLTDFH